jgi:hypothetical protein
MADIPTFRNLSLERHGNVFVLTMQKPPENRLNSLYCQEMIRAYRTVEKLLGPDSEGAVITRGNDAKFWCTVCVAACLIFVDGRRLMNITRASSLMKQTRILLQTRMAFTRYDNLLEATS